MRGDAAPRRAGTALVAILLVQVAAAVFFVADVVSDLSQGVGIHLVLEAVVTVALVAGVVFAAREMRRTLEQIRRGEAALAAARGALGEVIVEAFVRWRLTPAEADVALFALKGLDIAAIAAARGAAPGTVRAQLARVYGKAGVSSRAELLSLFMDELMAGIDGRAPPAVPSIATEGAADARPSR